jgi:hypothetical protein
MNNCFNPGEVIEDKSQADEIADLKRRVQEIESRQRIISSHVGRLLAAMEHHHDALVTLENGLAIILKAMNRNEKGVEA